MRIKKRPFSASTIILFLGCSLAGAVGWSLPRNRWRTTAACAVKLGGLFDSITEDRQRPQQLHLRISEGIDVRGVNFSEGHPGRLVLVLISSPNDDRAMLYPLLLRRSSGYIVQTPSVFQLMRKGEHWRASEGEGGPATAESVAAFVQRMMKQRWIGIRLPFPPVSCTCLDSRYHRAAEAEK